MDISFTKYHSNLTNHLGDIGKIFIYNLIKSMALPAHIHETHNSSKP